MAASPHVPAASSSPTADGPHEGESSSGAASGAHETEHPAESPGTRNERKLRVLSKGTASIVASISDAVVAKDGEPFFLCPPDGQVPCDDGHGYGFYFHDCRFLGGYELAIADTRPSTLAATGARGSEMVLELSNPELRMGNDRLVRKEQLGITWTRRVEREAPALVDTIEIRNYGRGSVSVPLTARFAAGFEDIFEIRGLLDKREGRLEAPTWHDDRLEFRYDGADGVNRFVEVTFGRGPSQRDTASATFDVSLDGRDATTLAIRIELREKVRPGAKPIEQRSAGRDSSSTGTWPTTVRTSSIALGAALERSFGDLATLRAHLDGQRYYEAGIPWFATLFGRDALITGLETLAFDPAIAADTLRLLAGRQGTKVDHWRDEAPGKILHELRIGELARLGEVPHTPYYGTIDATPLFLVLLGRHAAWTGSLDLFDELRSAAEAALGWIDREIGDGYLAYDSETRHGLANQGWKDSGDAIVTRSGDLATPPIALCEVQGYVHRAWLEMADLFERSGDGDRAARLRDRAAGLRERFDRDYWVDDEDAFALARDRNGRCEVVSSNSGQVLWSGIAEPGHAATAGRRLLKPDMFNGWGIRTLSKQAAAYQPIGYHLGTVWPHDNALIAEGLRAYGLDDEAERLFVALVEAAQAFPHQRLPECFAGYDRADYGIPVRYPVACHPQAWAAGAIPFLLTSTLGLAPDGFERRLRLERPRLPGFVDDVEIHGLAVAGATVDLRFERRDGRTYADVLDLKGDLDIVIDPHREPADG